MNVQLEMPTIQVRPQHTEIIVFDRHNRHQASPSIYQHDHHPPPQRKFHAIAEIKPMTSYRVCLPEHLKEVDRRILLKDDLR